MRPVSASISLAVATQLSMLRLAITTSAPQRAARERHLAAQPAAAAGDQHHPVGEVEKLIRITHFRPPSSPVDRASSAAVAISCGIIAPNASVILGSTLPVRTPAAYVFSSTMPSFQFASTR